MKISNKILLIIICLQQINYIINICPIVKDYESLISFSEFNQLNFTSCYSPIKLKLLNIHPTKNIILNNSLNMTGLTVTLTSKYFYFVFQNIKGIDFTTNFTNFLKFENNRNAAVVWEFKDTNFDFYFENKMINNQMCNSNSPIFVYYNNRKLSNFFYNIRFLFLEAIYSKQTCSLLFHNSIIYVFKVSRLSSSLINKNILSFISSKEYINSLMGQLILDLYHYDLNSDLLENSVFSKLKILDLNGPIKSIEDDLFKPFRNLKNLRIRSQYIKHILVNKNKWLNYLNQNILIDLNDILSQYYKQDEKFVITILQTFPKVSYYDFPNEDFCYFKDFPHQRLVLPVLKPIYYSSCSCTELFLIQYSFRLAKSIQNIPMLNSYYFLELYYSDDINEKLFSKCINKSLPEILEKCKFKQKLKLCNIKSLKQENNSQTYWYIADWRVFAEKSYVSFVIYMNPIVSMLCFVASILVIKMFTRKNLKQEIKYLYFYFMINSISILIFVILNSMSLITECTYSNSFCSIVWNSLIVRYINTFALKSIQSVLITFSNMSYASFILRRYIKITSSKNVQLLRINKLSIKCYLLLTIVFGILINLYSCFEYLVENRPLFKFDNEISNIDPSDNFKNDLSENEFIIFTFFQCLKIILSDLTFFILGFVIDILLIKFIQNSIENPVTSSNRISKKNTKRRISNMIILNVINFFFLKLPLALMDFIGLFFNINNHKYNPNLVGYLICRGLIGLCDSLKGIFIFFYLCSYLIQFFVFYKLDLNFKNVFKIK